MDQHVNTVELNAQEDGKITNVSVYSGRAEITRLFEFKIKAGQNDVTMTGLPRRFQEESLRVEGRGNASIHDVIISKTVSRPKVTDNSEDIALNREYKDIKKALNGAKQARDALKIYLSTINADKFDIPRLDTTLEGYMALNQKISQKILNLKKDLVDVSARIEGIKLANREAYESDAQSWQASINVHGQINEEIAIIIKYAVYAADWTASYDIRVDTQAKEQKVVILYKAIVSQATGESWYNVPLTLQTASPSFGINPPSLATWRVSVWKPQPPPQAILEHSKQGPMWYRGRPSLHGNIQQPAPPMQATMALQPSMPASMVPAPRSDYLRSSTGSPRPALFIPPMVQQPMIHGSNKGNVVATFQITGLISVPNDGGKHNVTVAELNLDAALMWYAIPSSDTRVHMKAKIRNNSDYTFVPGSANIYVDGSFIATTKIPSVSPQEVFDCPLGLDTSIRITYHPRKKNARSGFYSKTSSQSFTQRITVLNTKSTTVKDLKVIDHVPVSEDERIEVKIATPALTLPDQSSKSTSSLAGKNSSSSAKSVKVASNVVAQWDGAHEDGIDQDGVGRNGKFNWVLSILSQKSVSLVLQCEVNYPENLIITGM